MRVGKEEPDLVGRLVPRLLPIILRVDAHLAPFSVRPTTIRLDIHGRDQVGLVVALTLLGRERDLLDLAGSYAPLLDRVGRDDVANFLFVELHAHLLLQFLLRLARVPVVEIPNTSHEDLPRQDSHYFRNSMEFTPEVHGGVSIRVPHHEADVTPYGLGRSAPGACVLLGTRSLWRILHPSVGGPWIDPVHNLAVIVEHAGMYAKGRQIFGRDF